MTHAIFLCNNPLAQDHHTIYIHVYIYSALFNANGRANAISGRLKLDSPSEFRQFATALHQPMTEVEKVCIQGENRAQIDGVFNHLTRTELPELYDSDGKKYNQGDEFLLQAERPGEV